MFVPYAKEIPYLSEPNRGANDNTICGRRNAPVPVKVRECRANLEL
jgi:hypothetical protein